MLTYIDSEFLVNDAACIDDIQSRMYGLLARDISNTLMSDYFSQYFSIITNWDIQQLHMVFYSCFLTFRNDLLATFFHLMDIINVRFFISIYERSVNTEITKYPYFFCCQTFDRKP